VANPDASPFVPPATDQGNSTGGSVEVFHPFTGLYVVVLHGLGTVPVGVAHVTQLGSQPVLCVPERAFDNGDDVNIRVFCREGPDFAVDVDAPFTLSYLSESAPSLKRGALATFFLDTSRPPGVSYNSEGGKASFKRLDFGVHSVRLGRMGSFKGVLLASGNGGTSCQIRKRTARVGGPLIVVVACASLRNVGQDQPFTLTFLSRMGLKGIGGINTAYVFADRPTTHSYVPSTSYSSLGRIGAPRVTRTGVGRYSIRLPGMPPGGAVQVTALNTHDRRCALRDIPLSGPPPQLIKIRCSRLGGTAADTRFFLDYEG
jgi:hypothetical protein